MEKLRIQMQRVSELLPPDRLPVYATPGAAAMDLSAAISEPIVLAPMGRALIPTGVALALPDASYVALVFARSGLAVKRGLALSNGVGVIDSDYRGEIRVGVVNLSDTPCVIEPLERIAQLAVMPVCICAPQFVEELPQTERGVGGFGSTGTK